MRRFKITNPGWAASAAVALAMCQFSCKGPLDDEESLAEGLVPAVGQPVAGALPTAPGQIDPATAAGVQPLSTAGTNPELAFGYTAEAGLGQPQPAIVPSAPEPVIPTVPYVVQKGDSLSQIAAKNGTTVATLQKLNGITGSFIRYGQSIKVPAPAGTATVAPPVSTPAPVTETGTASGLGTVPSVPAEPTVPPPPSGAGTTGTGTGGFGSGASGLGFGGSSEPRPRTPSTTNDDFLNIPSPN